MLRARKPEAVVKRLKMFMFGPAGVGKTTAAIQFPKSYIIDGETVACDEKRSAELRPHPLLILIVLERILLPSRMQTILQD